MRERSGALCRFGRRECGVGVAKEPELEGEVLADEESLDDADSAGLCE
jgi:hypothetical protein